MATNRITQEAMLDWLGGSIQDVYDAYGHLDTLDNVIDAVEEEYPGEDGNEMLAEAIFYTIS